MEDQTTDLSASQQPAGTTKIENGIAYDISGKPLGPANVPDEKETPAALAPPPGFKSLAPPPGFKPTPTMLQPPPGFKPAPAEQPAEETEGGDEHGGEGYRKIAQGVAQAVSSPSTFGGQVAAKPTIPGLSPDLQIPAKIAGVIKDAFFSTEAKQKWAELGEGASDMLHGQIAQGWEKAKDSLSPHVSPGSPMDIRFKQMDPTFKATGHPYMDDRTPMNPIVDIGQFVDKKEHPIGKALAETVSSFTTPDNVAIMVGTGGLGVASSAGKLAMANKLLSAGFTAQAIGAGYKNSQAFMDAYEKGDTEEAEYQLTHLIMSGAMATVAGSHTLGHDMPFASATDKAVAGKVVDAAKDVSASAGKVVGDVTNKIAGSLGISNDFNTVVKNLTRPSAKQYQVFKGKIANVSEDLQAILNKNPKIEDPQSFADAIDSHIQEHEGMLQKEAGVTADSNVPVAPNLMRDLSARLDKFFADKKGEFPDDAVAEAKKKLLERVLVSRNGEHLQQPNLFESENIRRGLNKESYPILGQKMNAYQEGALELAEELRGKIDKGFTARGVDKVEEWRNKEKDLIDVRDRVKIAQKKAEDMGEPSLWKSTMAKVGAPSAILAAAFGHVPGAAAIGLGVAADYLHQRATNPNALVERAQKIAGKNAGATAVEPERFSTANPNPNPPTTPPALGAGSGTIGPQIQPPTPITPVNHGLYADLASHYGETLGETPYADLEGRFLIDVSDKKMHGIPLQPAEKALLGKYNQHLANSQAESDAAQQKLAEEQKTAAEEAEAKKQEQAAAGLVTATHPPFETAEHLPVPARYAEMGYTPQRVGVHELAHEIMADEYGHGTGDIISHHHDQIDAGSLAEARWEKPNFMNEDGSVKTEKIPEILAILHAGVVGEELVHNVPLHENPADDIEIARKIVKDAGFTPTEAGMIMKAAEMKAREVLTAPGVTDIIKRYTEHRQAGLDKDTHMSAETVGQAVQEVRHARGKNATTDNEARIGKEDKTGTPGDESGGEGAAKGEPKKPVQPAGKGGASAGAGGGKETKTNIKPGAGAESGDGEEDSDRRLAEPGQPELAYRARATGEQGIPATGRPVATSSLESAQRYAENLEDMTGKPHEVVQFPLKGQKFKAHEGPHGDTWFEMHEAVPESAVNKGVPNTNIKVPEQPHKQRFEINVTRDGETKAEPIEAYSRAEAFKTAQKKFPDAQEFNLAKDNGETLPREQGYVVPTGKHLNTPNSRTGVSPVENTMVHELGHYMVGHNEGLKSYGVLRHTHPDMGRNSNAAVSWDTSDLYDPATRKYKMDKVPSILRMAMGGIAADEAFSNVPRGENNNFDPQRGGDGSMSVRLLRAAGYQEPVITQMMHTAIDQAKEHLTQKPVADIIQENKGTREPNLSKQFHYGPARLRAMGDEAARRLNEGNYRAGVGEGNAAGGANVAGREGEAAGAVGQRVQTNQISVPPERTTGVPEHDAAIKAGGGVPGGVTDFGEYGKIFNFHDPQTGSTLGFKEGQPITPESVKAQIQKSRDAFAAGEAKNREIKTNIKADRVSTRLPEGKDAKENALQGEPLVIGREALKNTPAKLQQKFADTVRDYPGVKIPGTLKDPQKVMDRFVSHVKDNLKFLYDQVEPEKQVANAKWYESANKLSKELADKHGISEPQAAATIATQSPQKDWDMNVSLARRIADIHSNHQDTVTTPEMLQKGHDIVKNTGANKDLDGVIDKLEGKKLSELTDPVERAAWVRLYDEAHNARDFHYIDPGTGENRGLRTNADGKPSKVAWGSLPQIDNALSVLKDGSRENISERLGGMHKVRNFFNNIIDPTNDQDVTIDTHAVAAGLIQPLGGNATEVLDNFGKAGKHTGTGVKGTYPLYADAYRQAAQEIGIKPRELQSVVWEHVRNMFPSEWKSPENEKLVKGIWQKYSDGKQSLDKTRQQILKISEEAQKGVNETREAAQKKALDKQAKLGHNSGVKALGGE